MHHQGNVPANTSALSPFSGQPTSSVCGRKEGRDLFVCRETGAVFFDRQQVGEETYEDYYPYLKDFDRARFAWELSIRKPHYEAQLKMMGRWVSKGRLVDVGAGPGYLVRVAADAGWAASGVEVSDEARRYGREVFGVEYLGLAEIGNGRVDAVTCHYVLEHIR